MNETLHTLTWAAIAALAGLAGAAPAIAQESPPEDPNLGIEPADATGEPGAATTEGQPANWFETRIAIEDLADAGDYEAALALGDRLLDLAAAEFGPASEQLADAHLLLADVARRAGNFRAAEEATLTAIEVLESAEGPLAPVLIDPFMALGRTYDESGDYAAAMSAFGEARNIGRRNFGLLNEDQLDIIDAMTGAAERLGEIEEAKDLQLEALTLVERNHDEFSREAIEARYKYALWLRRHNFYEEERRIYYQIERIVQDQYDGDPLMLVRALREQAASFREADIGDMLGLGGLLDALELLDEMADPPPLVLAQVLIDIGDWNVEFSRTGSIGDEYLRAWALLGAVEGGDELRERWFDDLNEVEISSLSRRGLSTDPADPAGYVVVYFTVQTNGRTDDIQVTDSAPPGFKDSAVVRLMREARFRPRIIGGELVPARRAYRFEFRYDPLALTE